MGVPKIVSRAGTRLRKEILEQVGCDLVVLPEEEVGHNVAKDLVSGLFFDQVEVGDQYSIAQMVASPQFIGKTVVELRLREEYRINIVTIKRRNACDRNRRCLPQKNAGISNLERSNWSTERNGFGKFPL